MERLRREAEFEEQRAVELHAVRYYLRNILWRCTEGWLGRTAGVTNYAQLLGEIRVWRHSHRGEEVSLVTFNYDTLLEDAARQALQLEIRTISGYTSRVVKIFKPHGSVNWVRTLNDTSRVDQKRVEHSIIALGTALELRPGFHVIENLSQTEFEGHTVYPALALPVNTKLTFECPDDHVAELKADVTAVTKLLVIGWRATEPHFLEFWSQPRKGVPLEISKIAIVAGSSVGAQEVQQNLMASGIRGDFILHGGGFSDFVVGPSLASFLAD